MKKLALIIVVALIAGISGNADAQKPFKGILTYTITYDGTWDAATLAQQPTETKMKILGKYSKSEMIAPGATVENITNGNDFSGKANRPEIFDYLFPGSRTACQRLYILGALCFLRCCHVRSA